MKGQTTKIRTAPRVLRWPAYHIASAWRCVTRQPTEPAVVIFFKQLGDTILLEPALEKLSRLTGRPVPLFVRPFLSPVVELLPPARYEPYPQGLRCRDVWCYELGSKATFKAWRTRADHKHLRLREPSTQRVYHPYVFDDITFTPANLNYEGRFYFETTTVPVEMEYRPPRLHLPPSSWAHPQHRDTPYILFNPVASHPVKLWNAVGWIHAVNEIQRQTGLPVRLSAPVADWSTKHLTQIVDGLTGPVENLTGQLSLREYMYLISRAHLVLTVDGACSHLAQAWNRPVVTIFSRETWANPLNWHYPNARSCFLSERPCPSAGIEGRPIAPEELVNRALALFQAVPA